MTYTHLLKASEHPIKSVTIYKETDAFKAKAEVVRTFTVDLKSGENKIEVRRLSSALDTDSARVTGLGDKVRLFDVVCTIRPPIQPEGEVLRRLQAQKKAIESEKRVREHQSEILINYGKSLQGEHVTPEQATNFLDTFVTNGRKHVEAVMALEEELVTLERQIKLESDKLAERKGEATGVVFVTVSVQGSCRVEFKLTYIVGRASWEPSYDLHATTASGQPSSSVSLQYRARVLQSTGEDWKDTILTLSTASADVNSTGVPLLKCLHVKPYTNVFTNKATNNKSSSLFSNNNTNAFPNSFNQTKSAFSLFVAPQQASAPAAGGLFGGSTNASTSGGGLFGSATSALPLGGGGFGGGMPAPAFGSSSTSTLGPSGQGFGAFTGGTSAGSVPPSSSHAFAATVAQPASGFGSSGLPPAPAPAPAPSGLFGSVVPPSAPIETAVPLPDEDDEFEEVNASGTVTVRAKTVVSESPLSMTFTVDGRSSVPSDGIPHQVLITSLPFQADVAYVCVPRAETVAYLQCKVKNTSDYRLLPGPVSVFLDDSFVSKTNIQDIKSGDTFECTLGADPAVRITYIRGQKTTKDTGGVFTEQYKTVTYTASTTVRNAHRFALPALRVLDGVPLAGEAKGVKVVLRRPDGLAEAKCRTLNVDGVEVGWKGFLGEDRGQVEWAAKVEAGGEVKFELEYEVRGPAEMHWYLKAE